MDTDPSPPSIAPTLNGNPLMPTHDQIVVYAVVLFGLWNIPGARVIINPLKLFAIGWHELCHAIFGIMTGGTIMRMTIDPSTGGCTIVQGGHPPSILCAGYVGSSVMGGLFILGGFDTLVAKILSFVAGVGLIAPLALVRDKLTILFTVVFEGLLIGFWFIDHAQALRWYMLFLGMLHILYVIWDITDEKFFRKPNDSDCTQFSYMYKSVPAHVWAMFWIVFQLSVLVGFILVGIVSFKLTKGQMYVEAKRFLPT
ncbi:peptidase M50B-like-domain-containing protein [Gloeopeniophorella convolvens]|nr:peptidase M50B-like-domain-containing protein [Gloeopeniophorella convolvens]